MSLLYFFQPATVRVRPAQGPPCLSASLAQDLSSWTKASVWSPVETACSPGAATVTVWLHFYNSDITPTVLSSCGKCVVIAEDKPHCTTLKITSFPQTRTNSHWVWKYLNWISLNLNLKLKWFGLIENKWHSTFRYALLVPQAPS